MDDQAQQLNHLFAPNASLTKDILSELESICRLYSLDAQELFYKWESYAIKMGAESTLVSYKTVRDFRKDLEDAVDRESRAKVPQSNKKQVTATPRVSMGGDSFAMMDGIMGGTPARTNSMKRKPAGDFQTPATKAMKNGIHSSPLSASHPTATTFADRSNPGQIMETLNAHLPLAETPSEPVLESRVKLKANTDLPRFAYRSMAMKLSSASEMLDDRIDNFTELVCTHHKLSRSAFGSPAAQSSAEIVAVGRIACDQPNGKLNAASLVLEADRQLGAGMRVPLKFEDGVGYDLFPGKIVALRGTNVSGQYFSVSEVLAMPIIPPTASTPTEIDIYNDRLTGADGERRPLSLQIACGPYTTEAELDFVALNTLLENAAESKPDVLILTGPFLDLEHPVVASGDFEAHLPADAKIDPDRATLNDVFRALIASKINALVQATPSIIIIMVPSIRDAISKHVSFPQDRLPRPALGLPKQVQIVTNPIMLSINEIHFGIVSEDVLSELRRSNVYRAASSSKYGDDVLARLSTQLIDQRHFFPVFPPQAREDAPKVTAIAGEVPEIGGEERLPVGASLDLEYLKLGEWLSALPDVLITPSVLTPFAKVIRGVLCINPGTLSKKRGAGTLAAISVQPRQLTDDEREADVVLHKVYERARVDITRI
ncbi:hypothetical protein AMS68_000377 [Peltaster fructicola]|uniref:DNA polymerase alpha subunit B n=1 Tax=Peltaster fructicola TaxID=286661 RepID=A0A6H0XK19_9PEZI|nr:hypothetical protein AMS68_000377 [Peltaster fructicola]